MVGQIGDCGRYEGRVHKFDNRRRCVFHPVSSAITKRLETFENDERNESYSYLFSKISKSGGA